MRSSLRSFALCLSLVLFLSCAKEGEAPRILVQKADGTSLTSTLTLPLEGGSVFLRAKASASLDIFYEQAQDEVGGWFVLEEIDTVSQGEYLVTCSVQPLTGTLDLRHGTLGFSAPDAFIGRFLDVRQGYERIFLEEFSSLDQKELLLKPGESWESGLLTGISAIKDAWLAFDARAEAQADSNMVNIPVLVEMVGGATFPDIARVECMTDVSIAGGFSPDGYRKLHIFNGGVVFSSESKVRISLPEEAGAAVHIDNLSIYEIPVARDSIIGGNEDEENIEE